MSVAHSGSAWTKGTEKALDRDDRLCQSCGRDDDLHVHHIIRPEEFDDPDEAHHPSNLVTLCKYCHPEWEGRAARPILLAPSGVRLSGVVAELAGATIYREMFSEVAEDAFKTWIEDNSAICSQCFRRQEPPGTVVQVSLQTFTRRLAMGAAPGFSRPVDQRRPSVPETCLQCDAEGPRRFTMPKEQAVRCAGRISERLDELGIEHRSALLVAIVAKAKSTSSLAGKDHDNFETAVAYAVRRA